MIRLKCVDTGEWIELDNQGNIKSGGEGSIYPTNKPGFVAKVYHTITQEKIDKLQVMVKNKPADPTRSQGHVSIAWPKCLLEDSYGKILGFLMPVIDNGEPLISVYNHNLRKTIAPAFNWLYLHTTAINIASIVEAIHTNKYVVGDLKPENMLVTSKALVSIVDTDSFQIFDRQTGKIYRSPVASQEFTPREMLGQNVQNVDRSEFQDRFALAVIIWHLLFGYHPFSGTWSGSGKPPNIDQLIEHGYWMYGSNSKLRPGKLSMPINIIHPELQKLFRKCFNDGHNQPYARPSAADWRIALDVAIKELNQCSVEGGHYYSKSYHKCYWCERKRQLNGKDMFATPPGIRQPNVSTKPKAPVSIPQKVTPPQQVTVPISQQVQRPQQVKPPQGKTVKKTDKFKALIGSGVIVLILSAIALPSFTNQANKVKQSEAKQYVASMNKGQEAVFAEKASFATKIPDLGLGIKSETENYKYQIPQKSNNSVVVAVAEPKKSGLKGYVGIVAIEKDSTSRLFLCEQSQASTSFPDLSTIVNQKSPGNNVVQCPAGYEAQEGSPQSISLGSSPNSSPKEEVRSQTNSPTPSVSEERVNFDKGSTQKTISSSLVTNQTKRYSINCGSGQPMTVQIKQGDVNVAIISPNGQAIGNAVKAGTQWKGQLPSEGDYIIEVSAPNQSDYTINIEVLPSKNTPVSSTPATNTPVSSTPEQTLKNFYELTVKDNKAAGKKFTTDNFRKKYSSTDADNQKTFVSNFNSIEVIDGPKPTKESSPTRPIMTVSLRYSPKNGSPQECEYRDFTFVLNNNSYLIDNVGTETKISCP
ncbi:type IV pilin-like G/H family protein [Microcoleus sp. herbarium14]|uniref:type IV pilin-like G/H family protein n=1 Tax=Microcoleus sp. herbarium14 TaxID=3055439 RepID=UPI002FD79813